MGSYDVNKIYMIRGLLDLYIIKLEKKCYYDVSKQSRELVKISPTTKLALPGFCQSSRSSIAHHHIIRCQYNTCIVIGT